MKSLLEPNKQIVLKETVHIFSSQFINSRDIIFTKQQLDLLNKGVKYNVTYNKDDLFSILINTERAVQSLPGKCQNNTRCILTDKTLSLIKRANNKNNKAKNTNKIQFEYSLFKCFINKLNES